MDSDRVVPLDLGVVPEAAVSGGFLIQSEHSAWFLFNAMRVQPNGRRVEAGIAVVELQHHLQTRFGHPNVDALPGHPVLGQAHEGDGVYEVLESSWLAEVQRQNRIVFPEYSFTGVRHFIVTLHDATLECLANNLVLEACLDDSEAALRMVIDRAFRGS